MGATAVLSEFASNTRITDISAEAVAATKRHILDCTGVALAATAEPAGRIVLDVTREQGGAPQARVIGSGLRTSTIAAAWANGALAHLLDFDDTGFSHPTACILPAALAMAEEAGSTGGELVAAICVGLEVFERMSSSGRQHEPELRRRGFHPTSVYGCSAAAAAAGSIAGLNPKQMAVAIGLAAANAGGLTQHFGTWGKGIHAGNAARAGVTSVLLARKDYFADPDGIEGDYGFFSAFHGAGNYNLDKVADGLGTHWSIVDPGLTVKRYPCCGGNLRALDAAQALLRENDIRFDDVARLEVDVHPGLLHVVRFHKPTQGFRGKFSIDYVLAAMLLDGRVDLDSFTDEYLQRAANAGFVGQGAGQRARGVAQRCGVAPQVSGHHHHERRPDVHQDGGQGARQPRQPDDPRRTGGQVSRLRLPRVQGRTPGAVHRGTGGPRQDSGSKGPDRRLDHLIAAPQSWRA